MQGIVAGVAGGLVFLIGLLGLKLPMPLALVLGCGVFGLVFFAPARAVSVRVKFSSDPDAKALLEVSVKKANEIQYYALRIHDMQIRGKVENIQKSLQEILDKISAEPKTAKTARQFLGYYLDALLKIVKRYDELEEHKEKDPEIQLALGKANTVLDSLHVAFQKHHARLLEGDVMDLDTEIKVLEKTIKMEG